MDKLRGYGLTAVTSPKKEETTKKGQNPLVELLAQLSAYQMLRVEEVGSSEITRTLTSNTIDVVPYFLLTSYVPEPGQKENTYYDI